MELREYFKIIKRHLSVFLIVVLLSGIFAFAYSKMQPTKFTASTTFTVNKASSLQQKDANYYLYDNYYNVQSAGLFSQIVATWFGSPSLVVEMYKKADQPLPNTTQRKLSKIFKAVREEPATINVTISGTDKVKLEKLMNSAAQVMQDKTNQLGKSDQAFYELAYFTPIVTQNSSSLVLNTIIGLIAGVLLGAVIALGIAYFKEEK